MSNCAYCGKNVGFLPFKCRHCGKNFCAEHRMPENHDCSQDLEIGNLKDEIVKKVLDKEVLPEFLSEDEELIDGTKVAEETIDFEATFSGSFSMKAIKGHIYEIRYSIDRPSFEEFSIIVADGKHSLYGTSPSSKTGKFSYKALRTGIIAINARYNASLNDYPRIHVNIEVFDLGAEEHEIDREIPITLEEKQIISELESHLTEKIPVLDDIKDDTFGMVLEDGHIKHLALYNKGLKDIPASIWTLEHLKTLNLSSNLLEKLPNITKWNDSLKELDLSHNTLLTSLPEKIDNLKILKKLNLSRCESLNVVPRKFKDLKGLDFIDMSYCNFYIIPDLVNEYEITTNVLDFRGNPISLEEREKIFQWNIDDVLVEPLIFFIEERSENFDDSSIDILEDIVKTDPNEYNKIAALFIIVKKYLKEEIPLIEDIVYNEDSSLILTTLFRFLNRVNNKISQSLRKKLIMRYSEIYHITEDQVQFFIDLEAELIETGSSPYEDKVEIGYFTDQIWHGPDLLGYKKVPDHFGDSDEFKFYNFWVKNGSVMLLSIPGVRFLNKTLPESIGYLKDLIYLHMGGTNIKYLPKSFENIKNLDKIFFDINFDFQDLNDSIKKALINSISRNYHNLGMSSEELKALAYFEILFGKFFKVAKGDTENPNGFVLNNQNQVIAIYIFGDIFGEEYPTTRRDLPNEIAFFKNLEEICFNGYHLSEIPKSIGNLKNLKKIDLSYNEIDSIPDSLDYLKNLEELNLNSNKFKIIPNEFKNLQNLKRVEINYNKLISVPKFTLNLKNLEILDLSNNNIDQIPKDIINVKSLKSVNLTDNFIKHIPDSIEKFLKARDDLKL
ncbi:MAG: AN1-type zinc finger domain-containing protein [Candidatus Hermodarchaeota archaeon]